MAVHRYVKKADALVNRRIDVRSRVEVEVALELVEAEVHRAEPEPPAPIPFDPGPTGSGEALSELGRIPTRRTIDGHAPPAPGAPAESDPFADLGVELGGDPAPAAADEDVPPEVSSIGEAEGAEGVSSMDVQVGLDTETNFYTGLSQDISTGGVFVATSRIRPVGDQLTLRFSLPDIDVPIVARAEVRWTRDASPLDQGDNPPGMGLRFIDLSAEAKQAIATFLDRRESLFYDDE
jgi:uncharacterized protein (TIGR02266 family)